MTERVEECTNDWPNGTCPRCGETHYVIVRRSALTRVRTALVKILNTYHHDKHVVGMGMRENVADCTSPVCVEGWAALEGRG